MSIIISPDRTFVSIANGDSEKIENYNDIYNNVLRINNISHDFAVPVGAIDFNFLRLEDQPHHFFITFKDETNILHRLDMTNWALSQICAKYHIPASYICDLLENKDMFFLAQDNLCTHFRQDKLPEKEMFLRETSGTLCGYLSNRYSVYDDIDLMPIIKSSLESCGEYTAKNKIVSPEELRIRFVDKNKFSVNGDEYSVAFDISNSRVGRSSVRVQFLVYRWACTNGMIIGGGKSELFTKKHFGISADNIELEISSLIKNSSTLVAQVKENIEKSGRRRISEQDLKELSNEFRLSVYNNIKTTIEINNMLREQQYDMTMLGYANSVAQLAQNYSIETRLAMEGFAGKLLRRA